MSGRETDVRRCMWTGCPGLDKAIPMHEVEWGPEYHDYCQRLLVAEARLAHIAALCESVEQAQAAITVPMVFTSRVRAFLGGVASGVVPPQTIDRDALVTLLLDALRGTTVPAVPLADRILALVHPVPPQTIDRDDLLAILDDTLPGAGRIRTEQAADRILALVRPASGVILTPEEAALAAAALRTAARGNYGPTRGGERLEALATRLEASS